MKKQKFRSRFKPFDTQVSIGIATLSLILLILILAYSIKEAREQDRVRQFGERHAAIASTAAAGIEDTIAGVGESLGVFSRFDMADRVDSLSASESLQVLHETMKGKVRFVAITDNEDEIVAIWPENPEIANYISYELTGDIWPKESIQGVSLSHLIRLPKTEEAVNDFESAVILRVEHYNSSADHAGAILAVLSLDAVIDRYAGPLKKGGSVDNWLFSNDGLVMVHSDSKVIGNNLEILSGESSEVGRWREFFSSGTPGYEDFIILDGRGDLNRTIIAIAPVTIYGNQWTIALVTPYSIVVELMRKVFLNIFMGAMGLITLLVISGASVGYVARRQMKLEDTLKRLKEREDWQSKLVRQTKTVEGIIEGSPVPTLVIGNDHRIMFWNKALAELTGSESRDMVGTDRHSLQFYKEKRPLMADIIVDGNLEKLDSYYGKKQIQKSGTVKDAYEAYDHFENLNGKNRYLYFLAAPIYDGEGNLIAAIETLQDITLEKELELNLKEYAETIQNELEANIILREEIEGLYSYLQFIIDSLPEKILDINADGIIKYISKENVEGKKKIQGTHFVDFVSPENRELVFNKWEDMKKGYSRPFQMEVTDRKGSRRLLLLTPRSIPGTDRVLLVQQDITEIRQLQKTIFDNEKLAALGHLSAGIAHELRNALSSIKMSLQVLERRMGPTGNDLKRFQIAQREVEHLSQLVRDVLLYAKPAEPEKEISELETILEHSLAMLEKELTEKRIIVMKKYEENLPPVDVDQGMITQAILNIILNAVDSMDEGGRLDILAKQSNDDPEFVLLEIRDNGCGIEEEFMSSLFNPFFSRKKYGTGLGLAQAKKIMDVHQGRIEIFSAVGEGTRVLMAIPASKSRISRAGINAGEREG
ncbi:MAG: ATP-binding protein [Syntrophales bacterium]|nr:ATP-binding protein [Syntrophales bacterium]